MGCGGKGLDVATEESRFRIMNNATLWAKSNTISRCFASDFTKEYDDELGKMSGRCLDIGSGPADVVVDYVLPRLNPGATIVCSDISDPMIEFAKEKYKANHRVTYIKLDIETPDLPKDLIEQFDHATSFYCIHWCQDMRRVFENIFNLLRPGGTILLAFVANFPGMDCYKELAVMPRYQPYMKDTNRFIPVFQHAEEPQQTLKALIKDVGFEVHHCSIREKCYTFDSSDAFTEFVLSINPFVERMPDDVKKKFEKDLAKKSAGRNIVFNKNTNDENEYSVLCIIRTFLVYLRKPLIK